MKQLIAFLLAVSLAGCTSSSSSPPPPPPTPSQHLGAGFSPGPVGPFVFPTSWSQATWFVDRQNVSTCASDNNLTCSLSTCGTSGDGPCATYSSIASRWGTYSPRLRQSTTITWMSGESSNNDLDPVYFNPSLENQASAFLTGTPTTVATTTLGTITAKSITTSPSLLLAIINTDAGALAAGDFIVNSTHPGEGWLYANTSGSTWSFTQPLPSAQTTAIGTGIPFGTIGAEQNSYTSGDSVTIETFPSVELSSVSPTVEAWNSSFGGGIYVSNLTAATSGHGNRAPLFIGASVLFGDVLFQRGPAGNASMSSLSQSNSTNVGYSQEFYNCYVNAVGSFWPMGFPISETANNSASFFVTGGAVTGGGTIRMGYVDLQQDVIVGQSAHGSLFLNGGHGTSAYLDTGTTLSIQGPGMFSMSGTLWGPGGLQVNQGARFVYPSGGGAAVANLLFQGAFTVSGQSKGCAVVPTDAAAPTCGRTLSFANLDSDFGAVSGCWSPIGAGQVCNYSP
jgi:hypothetical protein